GVRREELRAAAHARVLALRVVVPVLTGERALGALLPRDPVLLGRELRAPLGVGLPPRFVHRDLRVRPGRVASGMRYSGRFPPQPYTRTPWSPATPIRSDATRR